MARIARSALTATSHKQNAALVAMEVARKANVVHVVMVTLRKVNDPHAPMVIAHKVIVAHVAMVTVRKVLVAHVAMASARKACAAHALMATVRKVTVVHAPMATVRKANVPHAPTVIDPMNVVRAPRVNGFSAMTMTRYNGSGRCSNKRDNAVKVVSAANIFRVQANGSTAAIIGQRPAHFTFARRAGGQVHHPHR